ncbi:MAG: hypothetical protein BWX88_03667 [Planctomycetes bacterium ADurb.Bin126]|nr:MAG: hypothetical protein BWX88_03667 [Planctomycetes bacterium ADurb.Bin126]HOD84644.1 hypothetical protein [Phycisphaerae bacterium]HQL76393.1 hypothetical protein [Phycisphaerae bacterium]
MTTISGHHYRGVDEIRHQLDAVRARRGALTLVTGIVAVVSVLLGSLLVLALMLGYWPDQPPRMLRWVMLGLTCSVWAAAFFWFIIRAMSRKYNHAQVARFVEEATPEARNDLINAILLSRDRDQVSPELVQQAIYEAVRHSRKLDLNRSVSLQQLQRWGIALAASAVLLIAFIALQGGAFKRGLLAAMSPAAFVPHQNAIELLSLEPGDTTKFAKETVTVVARIRNESGLDLPAEVLFADQDEPKAMAASEGNTVFALPIGEVGQTRQYAVRIGDSRWPTDKEWYTITVLKKVKIDGLDLAYRYPPYTNLGERTVKNADGSIQAPIGSTATVTVRVSEPVPAAVLNVQEASPITMVRSLSGTSFSADLPVNANGSYHVTLCDQSGRIIQRLPDLGEEPGTMDAFSASGRSLAKGYYSITALPDTPPKVDFLVPNRDTNVAPGGKLKLRVKFSDKYGLTCAALEHGFEGQKFTPVPTFVPPFGAKTELEYDFELDLKDYKKGDEIVYFATVEDNRHLPHLNLGRQKSESKHYKVVIQDPAQVAAEKSQRYEELRARLMAILKMQEEQAVANKIAAKLAGLEELKTSGSGLASGQRKIKASLAELAADKRLFDDEMATIQEAIGVLGNNEGQLAIDQAMVISSLAAIEGRDKACDVLAKTQRQIIERLQTLLAIMPSLGKGEQEKKEAKTGADLPPDVKEKLEKLKNDLDRFKEEERKILAATERLSKKPIDNLTPEDEKMLKDLEMAQDKLDKFINEAVTDFSQLAQQDFANPTMMKELLAIKSDVTMAKDALSKKATEIATALEDNGIENAKTLTANIEKWLSDKPDREKWSMEAPDEQSKTEQAELPTELEDLVGDLLEQEEDLFEEMEDQTSKYTMSGDKGIGWDALDGPIANMNAQGVTGNQLPNPNEMGGRSGEGRTGKSSGEFVEDKAVGKGGRRTPTRLSPEPFQKGQVNDQSTEPPGGATGGGKLSGSGEEGLEGPVPPPLAQEMKRLAGKQASLLNRAERIQSKFAVNDHSNFKLMEAITLMSRVKSDLDNYRYRNVLRARDTTVGAIQQAGLLMTGKIDVAADSTSRMPKHIREDIADAMKGKLPEEFRDPLEQYYRRLNEAGTK